MCYNEFSQLQAVNSMSMFVSILKKAVPLPKVEQYDRYLFVAPHPDDIEVGCGATVAKLCELGKSVTFVVVTDGSGGALDNSVTDTQLIAQRREECTRSAQLLGVSDIRFLNYVDGMTYGNKNIAVDIAKIIVDVQAQVVVCPDYKTVFEYHPDHLWVGEMATIAYYLAQYKRVGARYGIASDAPVEALAYYYTDRPNRYVAISKKHFAKKMQAIQCQQSQFDQATVRSYLTYFKLRNARFGMRIGKKRAEGYRVLGNVHMHCFPEAGEF